MYLAVVGIDYKSAGVSVREKLYFTEKKLKEKLVEISKREYKSVIISTCNRTEIYFSTKEKWDNQTAINEFSKITEFNENLDLISYVYSEENAVKYLFEMSCGLHSLILGEDQIITQVRNASDTAHEIGASDSFLNTLFRHALTCSKKAKTKVNINFISPSIVSEAVSKLEKRFSDLKGMKALVIGNGEMGKLAAKLLLQKGLEVCMTVRHYKYVQAKVVKGASSVPYEERADKLLWADVVFSATKSPHYTITYDMVENLEKTPKCFFDLALPRDIEEKISSNESTEYFDVDSIGENSSAYDLQAIREINLIINEQIKKFNDWVSFNKKEEEKEYYRFPLFYSLKNKKILVLGAGEIGSRRALTLLDFGAKIKVVATKVEEEIEKNKNIRIIKREFKDEDVDGMDFAVIATNNRALNAYVADICKKRNIHVNVCDDTELCDFFFPAIIENKDIIGGIVSKRGTKHKEVRLTAGKLRKTLGEE